MRIRSLPIRTLFLLAIFSRFAAGAFAQQPQSSPGQSDDVVRVNTALVQTDVTVFDRRGTFVEDLKREQFVLKIDGKPREISFFERVKAGSHNEEAQLAAARGNALGGNSAGTPIPLDRGRTIFFFVDDLHVSASDIVQVRESLKRFIDRTMGQNDEAAIITTSGQIGFLQQLTDNKAVLRAAVERITTRFQNVHDAERPAMSEYQAMLVEQNDRDVLNFFIDELLKEFPGIPRQIAGDMVRTRASAMLQQAGMITTNTLAALEGLVKSTARLPGRKLVLFVSGGFLLDQRNSDAFDRLRRVTSAAATAGVVIYSIDARGLVASTSDASNPIPFDPSGRLARASGGELPATQDGLNALARDTGGRAFFNTNALSAAVTTAVQESSVYYLLAWRPENEEQRNQRFRHIEVSVVGRPELLVRFRPGFGEVEPAKSYGQRKNGKQTTTLRTPIEELRATLRSQYPVGALPVSVTLNFLNVPQRGSVLAMSLKITTSRVVLESVGATQAADIDVAGVILDVQGKVVSSFENRLTMKVNSTDVKSPPPDSLSYNHFSAIKPGLYQVRVAAREAKHGRAGSGFQWIEIPDLASKTLALSTLIVGERKLDAEGPPRIDPSKPGGDQNPFDQVRLNVDHRFARSSHLRFLTFVYNAVGTNPVVPTPQSPDGRGGNAAIIPTSSTGAGPDLAVQVQVFRDNEPVITDPVHKVSVEGIADLSRLPYAAELALSSLQPGRYVLQVTVIDRIAKTSASQRFNFEVE
ncbi:MAG TPA: VWA domain-containing protein [Pyrinomonadaceae bacterium]|nr:VWA domain-containing protein [Pyrinomonadaceae bacterium]